MGQESIHEYASNDRFILFDHFFICAYLFQYKLFAITHHFDSHMSVKDKMRDRKKMIAQLHTQKQEVAAQLKGPQKPFMMKDYQIDQQIGNGVSSRVYKAINIKTGQKVAIKRIKNFLDNKHQSLRILREVMLLRRLKHPNIINFKQIIFEGEDPKNISLVLEYLETDVKKVFKSNKILSMEIIKRIIYQILLGLRYCQECQVLHRDLKPQNVLMNFEGSMVKLCDFGLARAVYLEVQQQQPQQMVNQDHAMKEESHTQMKVEEPRPNSHLSPKIDMTAHVSTRWYRAPELIILQRKYSNAIDIWSVGCILGELLTMTSNFAQRKPLFPGKACYPLSPPKSSDMNYQKINDFPHSVHDQLSVIFRIIGTPEDIDFISDQRAKNYIRSFGFIPRQPFKSLFKIITPDAQDFLLKSLQFNPNKRMSIKQAINHPFFDDIRKDYEETLKFRGQPFNLQLQNLQIPQIRELIIKQYQQYYNEMKTLP